MGPTKKNVQLVPSLADRIKTSNNSPLEPAKRSPNETKPINRDRLVRNFIRLYCRELAIRPLMIQAVAEARATNLEIINIYKRDNKTSKADENEHNEIIFSNKESKSKKQSTRRLKDIDTDGTTLADLVNGLTIQNKQGCSDLIEDTEDEAHKEVNVLISPDNNSNGSNKSLNVNGITGQYLNGIKGDVDTDKILVDNPVETLKNDSTNLIINDTINPHANRKGLIDNSDNSFSEIPHTKIIEQNDSSIQQISHPYDNNVSHISSISNRPLVPRYKTVRILNKTCDFNSDKIFSSNKVDDLEQFENEIRPISTSSTVTVLPSSETDEGVTYTTEEIASSSQISPDMERHMIDSPVPLDLKNKIRTSRALSFPEPNIPNKFTGNLNKGYRKQDMITENYFSDTPVLRPRKANQTNKRVLVSKFNKNDINSNRNRIDQVIDDQTRKTLVQNELKKFGIDGNQRASQKNGASSWKSNSNINTRTALNDRFLTMPDQFSSKSDPFHEFPKKLGWFLKSGELEYDERYTFVDKKQTKSKAYMNVQRQHNKRRTMDVVAQNRQRKTQVESVRDRKRDILASGRPFYNQEPRTPIITKRLRFMKGMATKSLQKRKPFITVV